MCSVIRVRIRIGVRLVLGSDIGGRVMARAVVKVRVRVRLGLGLD